MGSKLGHNFTEDESKERLLSQNKESSSSSSSNSTPVLGNIEDTSLRTTRWWCSIRHLIANLREFLIANLREFLQEKTLKLWEFGCSDPRKLIFSAKMGMALLIVSVIIFLKEPFEYLGQYSVWALLTVVLVFEFTIGGTFSKGFNRGLGTLSAGGLALGIAELSILSGKLEEFFIAISIFVVGFCTTFAKLYPTLKEYEYGFRVFLLTYCFIMVSGFSMEDFLTAAVTRFVLIALGAVVALIVNVCVYPIWAGEDLHNLVVKNFTAVATSLEGCVNGYLQCVDYERVSSKIHTYQASDDPLYRGYMSVIESTSREDTLQGFASWEPPHGPYKKFKYPWKNYVKVSGALRHCTFTVMALHGCLLSEIQAPPEWRDVFSKELQKVGAEGAKVLREIGIKVQKMEKLSSDDILLGVHEEAEELQNNIDRKLYLLMNLESSLEPGKVPQGLEAPKDSLDMTNRDSKLKSLGESENSIPNPLSRSWNGRQTNTLLSSSPKNVSSEAMLRKQVSMPSRLLFGSDVVLSANKLRTYESASALSLATFASLLIEFVARLQNLVNTFEELSEKANFKEPTIDEPSETEAVGFWARFSRFCSYKT